MNRMHRKRVIAKREQVNPIGDRIPKNIITTAFSMVKRFVDSSLDCDPYVDQPWVNGAILCGSAMTFRVGEKSKQVPEPVAVLQEGADGDGVSIRQDHGIPDDEAKRRKFFGGEEHRKDFKFEKGRCYQFDFHNGYIDWKNYALKLPGFSLSVLKWINDRTHTVRFVMKNRNTGTPYLIVTFRLLFGKELDDTLKNASQNQQPNGYTSTNNAKVAGGGAVATKSRDGSKHDDSNRSPAENSSHADPRAQGYVQTEPREGQSNSQLEPQNNVQKDSKEDHHTAESHSQEPDSRNMDEESRAISTKRAEKTDTENSDKNDREDAKQGSVVTNEHPDETPNRKDEMQDKTHHESQTHGQEVSNDNHHGLPLRRAQAASEYVNDESNGVGVVPAETQPFAFTEQPLISKPIADDTGVEAPTQASEQQDGDVQPRQGYRHSIEEILCQTASIDGRDKLSSVLK